MPDAMCRVGCGDVAPEIKTCDRPRGCGWQWRGPLPTSGLRLVRWRHPTNPLRRCAGWRRGERPARVGAPGDPASFGAARRTLIGKTLCDSAFGADDVHGINRIAV